MAHEPAVNRRRIQRLIRILGIEALYPKPILEPTGPESRSVSVPAARRRDRAVRHLKARNLIVLRKEILLRRPQCCQHRISQANPADCVRPCQLPWAHPPAQPVVVGQFVAVTGAYLGVKPRSAVAMVARKTDAKETHQLNSTSNLPFSC
jgi:hypothetical protein